MLENRDPGENQMGKRPVAVQVNWTDKIMQLGDRLGRVNYVNRRLFEAKAGKAFKWTGVVHHSGYCLGPTILDGDVSIIALDVQPQDGDIVTYDKGGESHSAWYRNDGQNVWLEAAIETDCDKMPLEGPIIGVVVINARFARLPYYEINPDQARQCESCPIVLRLLDMIALLSEGKNPNFPHLRGK